MLPPCSSVCHEFDPISISHLQEIITHLRPTICSLDIIPPRSLIHLFDTLGPSLLTIVNKSLSLGIFPADLKNALVLPSIKKPDLDPAVLNNYRPISNLPFISKILEKVVSNQLHSYLNLHSIYEKFQSGFRALHSTESALLKVFDDIYLTTDAGDSIILMLLDLSSAFDMVDHDILLSRLEYDVGLKGTVLNWFSSYLTDRRFSVRFGSSMSSVAHLRWGVPQGSILAPTLFSLYMLPLGSIF